MDALAGVRRPATRGQSVGSGSSERPSSARVLSAGSVTSIAVTNVGIDVRVLGATGGQRSASGANFLTENAVSRASGAPI